PRPPLSPQGGLGRRAGVETFLDAGTHTRPANPLEVPTPDRLGVSQREAPSLESVLAVDLLEDVEHRRDRRVEDRMEVNGPAVSGQHVDSFGELALRLLRHLERADALHVVAGEADDLAHPDVAEPVVAETRLDVADPIPDVGEL